MDSWRGSHELQVSMSLKLHLTFLFTSHPFTLSVRNSSEVPESIILDMLTGLSSLVSSPRLRRLLINSIAVSSSKEGGKHHTQL